MRLAKFLAGLDNPMKVVGNFDLLEFSGGGAAASRTQGSGENGAGVVGWR